jgi:tetratricopeptide (TPR) repeat protein
MLFLPYGLALDHAWPLEERLLTATNLLAGCGIAVLFVAAWLLRRRNRAVSFGIIWFFVALSVESTFIVLDPMFDHRLYLPMFGFCVVVLGLLEKIPVRPAVAAGACLVLVYGLLAWQRNTLWSDPVAFYRDNIRVVPGSYRARNELARLLIERRELESARTLLEEGILLNPLVAELYDNLGTLYDLKGDSAAAIACFRRAIGVNMHYARAYTNLGAVYAGRGEWGEAERFHRQALKEDPVNARARYNLGVALYRQKRLPEALEAFRGAAGMMPGDGDAWFNLGAVALELGDRQTAQEAVAHLGGIDSKLARELAAQLGGAR